ncbi:Mur ligase family protein [Clostridium cavendishii]|uniref:Mur ligase family protein n=1 Tax=Clostridium cavendishii TaxID=349931 RepID=UPI0009348DF0|nr:Mur ligase family protein [Clostridium cavendishii]
MSKIKFKSIISILCSKLTQFLSKKFLKGGSNFPGKIALKIDKDILKVIAKNYKVILVTGTNGKTTTTSMIYNVLKEQGLNVITNNTGANMFPGIVSSFISNFKFSDKNLKYAVIEVDEANVKFITEYINPEIITITNLFRDQLDRFGEVYTTLNKILEGINKVPNSKLLLNGDESLLGGLSLPNPILYYGFNDLENKNTTIEVNADAKFCKFCKAPYSYEFITYNHLGKFYCPNCGFKRADLKYAVNKVLETTSEGSKVIFNDATFTITQAGSYNIYNALCAYSIAKEFNISDDVIETSFLKQTSTFGRQEILNIEGKEVKIILVKNPAGYNQALDMLCLNKETFSAAFLLNDNYADGTDVSWIWDVDFEKLQKMPMNNIYISGKRLYDMAVRLKIANLNEENFIISENYDSLTKNIISSSSKKVYVLATYTAMINYRKHLHNKGYINKLW